MTNGKDSLSFDYGWYGGEIDDDGALNHLYCQDTINGLVATIQIPKIDGEGSIRINFPHVNSKDKLSMGGNNIKRTGIILKAFKSIVFKESDTTKNSVLTFVKFRDFSFGMGSTLFRSNCASCHHPTKNATGPALKDIVQERNNIWIYKFLTNRNSIVIDSSYKERLKQAGDNTCNLFPNLKQQDVDQIIGYIKGR